MDCAVIFDVDGVLLDLTHEEEQVFFAAFEGHCDPGTLSNDWNSYLVRNDDNIVDEILQNQGVEPALKPGIVARYFELLQHHLLTGGKGACPIPGAADLLSSLEGRARLGIATANYREAARLRLTTAGIWEPVSELAFGADGGGHKSDILARALRAVNLPPTRVVYIGDNINDVVAGLENGVNFVGFSQDQSRLATLREAGATCLSSTHTETLRHIKTFLSL